MTTGTGHRLRAGLLALALASRGEAQGREAAGESLGGPSRLPAEVYARAERLLGPNLVGLVLNAFVVPHWVGAADEFWYDRELRGGHEFVLVNAANGTKQPAFDHQAVARSLASTHLAVNASDLPFHQFEYGADRRTIRFEIGDDEYLCDLPAGRCRGQSAPKTPPGVLVSPDGRWGVLTREGNLWLRELATGAERALTTDGAPDAGYGIYPDDRGADYVPRERAGQPEAPVGARWAPTSARVVLPFIDQRHVAPYPFLESAPADGSFRPKLHPIRIPLIGERPATVDWYVIDLPSAAKRKLQLPVEKLLVIQQDLLPIRDAWWSRGGDHLYAVAHGDNMESAYLFDIDLATGAVRTMVEEHTLPRTDLNSTSYYAPNVWVSDDGADAIWFSQRDGWGHLYLYDGKTGALTNRITQGDWLVREIIQVDQKRRLIYFTGGGREGGNPYYRYLYRVSFDGSGLRLVSPEKADHLLLPRKEWVLSGEGITPYDAISPSGKYAVYTYSTVDQPPKTVIRAISDGKLIAPVEAADASALYAAGWRPPEEFVVKAADRKTDLWGVLYRPSDFDPKKKYPVLDAQYASPLTAVVPRHFFQAYRGRQPIAPSSYAELGFVVVSVDARGTTYRSKEFLHATYGKLNTIGLEDHIAALNQLAQRFDYLDLDRVGIYGHSYGGYVVIRAMLEFPDFFKVGISSAGIAATQALYLDYHQTAFHGRPIYSDGTEWRPSPTEVPKNWINLDARQQAGRLQGKLLIQLGELDENCPPGQMLLFIDALVAQNKDFEMLYLPGRNHQFMGEGYVMRRDWDFMVRHLLGKEPPEGYRIKVNTR